jgi:dTDP-4-dehydrorhamnose 3,5-epimerase
LIFTATPLEGAYVVELKRLEDERGFFARSFCQKEFQAQGLDARLAQCNVSFNAKRGTLRGLHYQAAPHGEAKLVRCTQGAIWDVMVDLRRDSPTFKRWFGAELSASNRRALYIPDGFAHGFQTLVDDAEVLYLMSEFYQPDAARGLRWNDPAFRIEWPLADPVMSERDRAFKPFVENA